MLQHSNQFQTTLLSRSLVIIFICADTNTNKFANSVSFSVLDSAPAETVATKVRARGRPKKTVHVVYYAADKGRIDSVRGGWRGARGRCGAWVGRAVVHPRRLGGHKGPSEVPLLEEASGWEEEAAAGAVGGNRLSKALAVAGVGGDSSSSSST